MISRPGERADRRLSGEAAASPHSGASEREGSRSAPGAPHSRVSKSEGLGGPVRAPGTSREAVRWLDQADALDPCRAVPVPTGAAWHGQQPDGFCRYVPERRGVPNRHRSCGPGGGLPDGPHSLAEPPSSQSR